MIFKILCYTVQRKSFLLLSELKNSWNSIITIEPELFYIFEIRNESTNKASAMQTVLTVYANKTTIKVKTGKNVMKHQNNNNTTHYQTYIWQ